LLEPWFTSVDGLSALQAGEDNPVVNLLEWNNVIFSLGIFYLTRNNQIGTK
jgi:hypothetical protein